MSGREARRERIYVKMFAHFALLSFFTEMRSSKINSLLFSDLCDEKKELLLKVETTFFTLITLSISITNFRKLFTT